MPEVFALMPGKADEYAALLRQARAGRLATRAAATTTMTKARPDGVAILPLFGYVEHWPSELSALGYATSTVAFGQQLDRALRDSSVGRIIVPVDSPGGTVSGVSELSTKMYAARAKKPIVAVADSLAASAAYWIASAANQVVVTPSGEIGSVGIISIHQDYSRAYDDAGVTNTILKVGKYKGEGNPFEPLAPEAADHIQSQMQTYYRQFVHDVARNRGVSPAHVFERYGEGRTFIGAAAWAAGLVDYVATLESVLNARPGTLYPSVAKAMLIRDEQRRRGRQLGIPDTRIEPGGMDTTVARYLQIAREQKRRYYG